MRTSRAFPLLLLAACASQPQRNDGPPVAVASVSPVPPAPPPVAASDPLDAPRPVTTEETPSTIPDEIFLSETSPPATLRRRDHVIVFVVQTVNYWDEKAKSAVERTRLVPILCATKSGINGGAACMKGAPERGAEVRFTSGGTHKMASTKRNVEECMAADNPIGKTDVWQTPKPIPLDRPTLAIWPADADVGMVVHRNAVLAPTAPERAQLKLETTGGRFPATPRVLQGFEEDLDGDGKNERVFSIFMDGGPRPPDRADISIVRASATSVIPQRFATYASVLATFDIAGDKKRQLVVYQKWVNDGGFGAYDAQGKNLHAWSCGNV